MGTTTSKNSENSNGYGTEDGEGNRDLAGGQLYVSLKMENCKSNGELVPHVYGSLPLIGSWDPSKSFPMERESTSIWELSFVVPPNHETLDFKFLLKPKYSNGPCYVEEGPNRLLKRGALQGETKFAMFKLSDVDLFECKVLIKADRVSPFDLAASWRAYQENLQPSTVRDVPDISMIAASEDGGFENGPATSLDDLERYVIPAPTLGANSALIYAANMTENPRSFTHDGNPDASTSVSHSSSKDSTNKTGFDRAETGKALCEQDNSSNKDDSDGIEIRRNIEGPSLDSSNVFSISAMHESKSVGTLSHVPKQDHRGFFVDRGVGSPKLIKSATMGTFTNELKLDSETKKTMPAAAGAVAAAAVADGMLGPKEDRKLAIVLVGLPARGKTFTAAKLTRYLRWLGHDTKHFNVGKYRRLKHGANQSADFFRADNPEGMEARNEIAALAMEDMISWMQEGGQVGIFDATNSARKRRNMLMKMAEGKCKIIFLETICNDQRIIERNVRLKIQQSPDYAEETDFEAGMQDFKRRLANYEKVYEPVKEGSYIKVIDMGSGHGGQIQVNTHLTPRPILLTRHGESRDNVRGRIGGDTALSESGELYAKKLANFVEKRLKCERTASVRFLQKLSLPS